MSGKTNPTAAAHQQPYYIGAARHCYIDAYVNRDYTLKHLNLTLKFGSLGIGTQASRPRNFIWEYGGASAKYAKLGGFFPKLGTFDGHTWLEDAHGLIYDYVRPDVIMVATVRSIRIWFEEPCVIYGLPKEELKEKGLVYLEASAEMQKKIQNRMNNTSSVAEIFEKCRGDPELLAEVLESNRCK